MIGGTDVIISTNAGPSALDCCCRIILKAWREAIFEDANSDTPAGSYEQLHFGALNELFVYRDKASADSWDALGADPSNRNSMIHLVLSASDVTIVVDELDAQMQSLVDAVTSGLNSLNMLTHPRIAA